MKAEIIAVGTEILLGNIVNTNAQYLSQELATLGYDMYYQSVVGDNFERLKETVKNAVMRSDVVIITGGLGPTPDDLSKEAAADALGLKLELDEESLKQIEYYFQKSGRKMSEANKKQAYFPKERCLILPNSNGTAPGCILTAESGSFVVLVPGVPYEMKTMFSTQVKPILSQKSGKTIVSKSILTAGIGESLLASIIPDFLEQTDPTVSPYCKPGMVTLRVTSADKTYEQAELKCQQTVDRLINILGHNVCGVDVTSLENVVVTMLKQKDLHLATAESCTAGKISAAITSVAGASEVFDFGASTYSNQMKHKLLGVKNETLEKFGAVSAETAIEMAKGIREFSGADIGLSVTGVAGPACSEAKPVGLVYIGLSDKTNSWVEKLNVVRAENDREKVRNNSVTYALDLVRRYLLNYPNKMPNTYQSEHDIINPENNALSQINKYPYR